MNRTSEELARLEALARENSIRVVYSRQIGRGGHCLLRGAPLVLIGSHLAPEEKVEVLRQALAHLQPSPAGS